MAEGSSSGEGFDGGAASSVSEGFDVGGVSSVVVERPRKQPRLSLQGGECTPRIALLVCSSSLEAEFALIDRSATDHSDLIAGMGSSPHAAIALLEVRWHLQDIDSPCDDEFDNTLRVFVQRKHRKATIVGYCIYRVLNVHALHGETFPVTSTELDNLDVQLPIWSHTLNHRLFDGKPLSAYLCKADKGSICFCFIASPQLCSLVLGRSTNIISVLPVCRRNRIAFQRKFPTRCQVNKWVRMQLQHCDVDVLDTRDQNLMLHLPRQIKLHGV